ncbi:RNA-dependent RNA polymerase 6 [Cucurbita moschata]|uniref:RNA-dependent RNA polymerase n=1 Tax=Cucurbita moschata TaxID=3662 RepID=A0A6J1HBE9_CUCMO|nr:RNA-dependent RNA polymerase 6 [Cucurbita moschata]
MGSEESEKIVVTQVSIGGFDSDVKAQDLMSYLESEIGLVDRCRLKTSWTPPESYPDFDIVNVADVVKSDDYKKVVPHAFVHFALPDSAAGALHAAGRNELFLNDRLLKVSLGPESPYHVNQRRRTKVPFKLSNVLVDIGNLTCQDGFSVAWRGPSSGMDFLVDPFDGTCKFCFTRDTAFSFKDNNKHTVLKCDYKVEFLVRDINQIKRYTDILCYVILLQLTSSPCIWYRTADDDIAKSVPYDLLDDDDPWIRTTDFTISGAIGRCNTYRVSVPPRYGIKLNNAMNYLKEQRVHQASLKRPPKILNEPDYGVQMTDHFFCIHYKEDISFELLFLVNAVMHKGIINQHQMTDRFFDLLRNQPNEVSLAALSHIHTYRHPVPDACKRLKLVQEWLLKNPRLWKRSKELVDIIEIRRLVITPSKAYCFPPEVELSNRVLRRFKDVADRFLRVTFMDEGMKKINSHVYTYYVAPIVKEITSSSFPQKTKVFGRMKHILKHGFYLCGRKYSFLAYSSNQLRDQSAWFFSECKDVTVDSILRWMGRFTNKNVAKCAARIGQCFSSTYATIEVPRNMVNHQLPDVERNDYIFSDGIGTITPDLAQEVADKLKLGGSPPCAYQIRYAGCKGVVASWPSKGDGIRLALRPSMNKFQSDHRILEICSWTRFQPGFLNRQIITLLSTLNVPDEIFWSMQETMVSKLDRMITDTDVAFDVLTASCAEQGNAAAIMLSAGFEPQTEPHLRGMLMCIRAAQLWGLREKARIFVTDGRWCMGCFDESAVLQGGQCFIQVSTPLLERCFSKHGSLFDETKNNLTVIRGTVVIAKNPCLHPGDVRILEAVDAPELHHLYDCLVFPQNGERPHTNEASGSDLDGDLYFITWDENLIPPSRKSWPPMNYVAAEVKTLTREVTRLDIMEFFAKNMINESLGTICNAHVVHADRSEYGALDENCIKLSELAATAVDFPKTGKIVTMPPHLKPKLYPDFMGKQATQSYKSTKILGRMYRRIRDAYDEDMITACELNFTPGDVYYDVDLEVAGAADFIAEAWNQKCSYDGQLSGLLGQYKVSREEEIVTGHIWSMPKYSSRKQGELKEKLKHSYSTLKKEFRQVFENIGPEFEQLTDDERNALYERKASAWYQVAYHPTWLKKSMELREPDISEATPMLSFPWIAADYLARIKIKCRKMKSFDPTKPINSLASYLSDRI